MNGLLWYMGHTSKWQFHTGLSRFLTAVGLQQNVLSFIAASEGNYQGPIFYSFQHCRYKKISATQCTIVIAPKASAEGACIFSKILTAVGWVWSGLFFW